MYFELDVYFFEQIDFFKDKVVLGMEIEYYYLKNKVFLIRQFYFV